MRMISRTWAFTYSRRGLGCGSIETHNNFSYDMPKEQKRQRSEGFLFKLVMIKRIRVTYCTRFVWHFSVDERFRCTQIPKKTSQSALIDHEPPKPNELPESYRGEILSQCSGM